MSPLVLAHSGLLWQNYFKNLKSTSSVKKLVKLRQFETDSIITHAFLSPFKDMAHVPQVVFGE